MGFWKILQKGEFGFDDFFYSLNKNIMIVKKVITRAKEQ